MSYADIIKKCQKDWDAPDLMTGANADSVKKIPFSSPMMLYATYGGIPRGCLTEFYGAPSGGKTSTAVDVCKNAVELFESEFNDACKKYRDLIASGKKEYAGALADLEERGPKKVFYLDLEHSFDKQWSAKLGIEDSKIDIMTPPNTCAEDLLEMLLGIIQTSEVGLIVLDSIPSLVPRTELDKKMGERTVSALAGLLTVFFRKLIPLLKRYDCTFLCINQTRDNMDNPYVVNTPGGNALKFYASLRMLFRVGTPVDFLGNELPQSAENPAGNIITCKLTKQKSAPNDRKAGSYYLMFATGIRSDFDYANLAIKKYGFIQKSGAWYTLCDPYTGEVISDENGVTTKVNGLAKVFDYLGNNSEYFDKVRRFVLNDICGSGKSHNTESEDNSYGL